MNGLAFLLWAVCDMAVVPQMSPPVGLLHRTFWIQPAQAEDGSSGPSVGMPGRIEEIVLPGTQLEVKPPEGPRDPIVLRIVESFPHGTGFRYTLEYYGLEPGTYDLTDSLKRRDGSSTDDLAPILVTVRPLLPSGQVEPHALAASASPRLGGYRLWLVLGAAAWLAGLAAILLVGRKRKKAAAEEAAHAATLAERLQGLVEEAAAGTLTRTRRAELERLLLSFWRRRLGLESAPPADAIAALREHTEAGRLLRQLDDWLHRPEPPESPDLQALLTPYQNVTEEEAGAGEGAAPAAK
jgi:hypothetical protein